MDQHDAIRKIAKLLTVVIAISGGLLFWDLINKNGNPVKLEVNEHCDLHAGSCQALSKSGERIEFSILPLEIPLLKPLELSVRLYGLKADTVSVVFSGIDIDMGRLSYPLSSTDGLLYTGSASLSICSSRKMRWQALVVIKANGTETSAPFLFDTEYRSNFKLI